MSSSKSDATLVIRARDDAQKAIDSVAGALGRLFGAQNKVADSSDRTGGELADLIKIAATLDKTFAAMTGGAERAETAFRRQQAAITAQKAELLALQQQAKRAADSMTRLSSADAIVSAGRNQSGRLAQLKAVSAEYDRLESQSNKLARAIASQENAIGNSASSLQRIGSQTNAVEAAVTAARTAIDQETRAIARSTEAAEANAAVRAKIARENAAAAAKAAASRNAASTAEGDGPTALQSQINRNTGVDRGSSGDALAAQLRQQAYEATNRELAKMDDYVREVRDQLNPTAAAERHLAEQQRQLNAAMKAGKLTATEYQSAMRLVEASSAQMANRKATGLFGLRPHELQNLGFQLNDIATQLASGTSLAQALGQQAGQIVQIPKIGRAILSVFTAGGGAGTVLIGVVLALGAAFKRAGDQAETLRIFDAQLIGSADGAAYQAKEMLAASKALDSYGLSAKEAVAQVRKFQQEGLDPSRFVQFGETIKDLADAQGVELTQATEQVVEAFTGQYAAIERLDGKYNFLSAAQLEHVRRLFDEGRAAEGRNRALDIFSSKMGKQASDMRGPWGEAVRSMGNAYDTLMNSMANSGPLQGLSSLLAEAAKNAQAFAVRMAGASNASETLVAIADKQRQITEQQQSIATTGNPVGIKAWRVASMQRELADLQKQLQGFQAESDKQSRDTLATDSERQKKADAAVKQQIAGLGKQTAAQRILNAEREAGEQADADLASDRLKFASDAVKAEYRAGKIADARRKVEAEISTERQRQRQEAEWLAKFTRFQDPVSGGRVTSEFGPRKQPKVGASTMHRGIDIAVPVGTQVKAPANGVVVQSGYDSKLGKFVYIDHGNNTVSKFGHLSDNSQVRAGQSVRAGQEIGRSGNTGNSTGPHLHYQVEVNGKPVDPRKGVSVKDGPGLFETDMFDATGDAEKRAKEALDAQDKFNTKLDTSVALRREEVAEMARQQGLTGDALIAAQREAGIREKIRDSEAEAVAAGVNIESPEWIKRVEAIRKTEGAYFDLANAADVAASRQNAVAQPVADLGARRDAIQQQMTFLRESGNANAADQLEPSLQAVTEKLQAAIDRARAFYETLTVGGPAAATALGMTNEAYDALVAKTGSAEAAAAAMFQTSVEGFRNLVFGAQNATVATENLRTKFLMSGRQINESIASLATNALDSFAQKVAEGANVFKSLWQAFRQFASDFLLEIAKMIIKQQIFNALGGATGDGSGGVGGAIAGAISKIFHSGGVVGLGGGQRIVNPAMFTHAPRYHNGGMPGLRSDEVAAILQRGEEVITRDDPRNILNGGGAAPIVNVETKNVSLIDGPSFLSEALSSGPGEKVFLNYIRANRGAVRNALG